MPSPPLAYRLALLAARAALPVAGLARPRLRLMARERCASRVRFQHWVATARRPDDPVVLLHAASAGELRQLDPILHRLRTTHPSWQLLVTWFSTSGTAVGTAMEADCAGVLPWDTPWATANLLDLLRPSALVIGKLDLWPELAWQAERRQIPVALIAATVRTESGRLRWPARWALQGAYASLGAAGAVSTEDAERLASLGVEPDRIVITGDPRYDSVLERLAGIPAPATDPLLLVAGSTWPADEIVLLPAFVEVRQLHPGARLLLVPHQPDAVTLQRLNGLAMALELPAPVPLAWEAEREPFLVEPQVGQLAIHYARGSIAYVGGGFGSAGLHSVLEPAAAGSAVIIGPRGVTREASTLRSAGALVVLDGEDPVQALVRQWDRWLTDAVAREAAGAAARMAVLAGRGAADRSVALVEQQVKTTGERSG